MKHSILALASLLVLFGCQKEDLIPVSSIELSKYVIEIYAESNFQLYFSVNPSEATDKSVEWTSNDSSVATVDNGNVIGVAPGKAIITVKSISTNISAQCEVTVLEKIKPSLNGLENYKLIWNDEFDYSGAPDANIWERQIYRKGAVNNEEQAYVNSAKSATVSNGVLGITAYLEQGQVKSARFHSRQLFQHAYYEAMIKIPKGKGVWPAFWLMGIDAKYGQWPLCGEVDILEAVGHMPEMVHSNVWSQKYSNNEYMVDYFLPTSRDEFHIYAAEVTSEYVRIYVDNRLVNELTNNHKGVEYYPYNSYKYTVVLNFAFGGDFGGAEGVDYNCLPATFEVDYVRVFSKDSN